MLAVLAALAGVWLVVQVSVTVASYLLQQPDRPGLALAAYHQGVH